ncbi:PAS domain S-box protein [Desulfonatronovibrio hydrogenovorans]|uniref:PAS domain S-box protein n=1 Tax=Desulfonatronovibrio hydrogenovorans TaxID=53245 RepID=UPI00068FE556|nr:PAS domain S-box protein [Desulfonatronovibrio hydrogenovorans]
MPEYQSENFKSKLSSQDLFDVFMNAPMGIFLATVEGRFLSANLAMARMLGYETLEVMASFVEDVTHQIFTDGCDWNKCLQLWETQGNEASHECALLGQDGSEVRALINMHAIHDIDGNVLKYQFFVNHVLPDKQNEPSWINFNQDFLVLLENTTDFIYFKDYNRRIRFCSQAMARITGHSDWKEVIGKNDFDLFPKETAGIYYHEENQVLEKGIPLLNKVNPYLDEDGRPGWVLTNKWPVFDDSGNNVVGLFGISRDITDLKQAELALSHSHDLLRYIVEHTRSSVAVHDKDLNYIYVSQRYLDEFKVKEEDILGKHHYEVFPDLPQKWRDVHQRALKGEVVSAEDDPYYRDDGTVEWTRWECRPWYEQNGSIGGIVIYTEAITERKNIEEALRESEQRYRTVFENTGTATCILEKNGIISLANTKFAELAGYPLEEIENIKTWMEFVASEDLDRMRQQHELRREARNKALTEYEFRFIDSQGSIKNIYLYIDMIPGTDKSVASLLDITELKRSESELINRKRLLEGIINGVSDVLAIQYPDLSIERYNQAGYDLLGMTQEEVKGKKCFELIGREWACDICATQKTLKTGQPEQTEKYIPELGIYLECRSNPIMDEKGNIVQIIEQLRDITERKNIEEKMQLNEKRLQALLDLNDMKDASETRLTNFAMEAAVLLSGSSIGYIAFPSEDETVLNMYAWSSQAMKECAIKDKPVQYNLKDTGLWGEAIRQRCPVIINDYSAPNPLKKGTAAGHIHIERYMSVPIFDGDRIVIVAGVGNKETDYDDDDVRQLTLLMSGLWAILCRKRSEDEREKLQDQLMQAQKMESVGILAGGVAHDFNNLLHTMQGNLELLSAGETLDLRNSERLQAVSKSIDRAAQLVQQLLIFSRKASSRMLRVDVNQEVQQVVQILKRTVPKMINLVLDLEPDIDPVSGDPAQIEQILLNLTNNAVDSMPDGGKLTITTANVEIDMDFVEKHPDALPGSYVLLAVTDTGWGMDKKTLKHIYDPFFTTKEVGQGTGLGLPSVYGIVKTHGGYIYCDSEAGQGTAFRVYLPVMENSDDIIEEQQPESLPQGRRETILVVDDEPEIRELTQESLEGLGYTVISAESGEEALSIFQKHRENIHLVLLDLNMPGMGGHKCLQKLLKIDPSVKVLIASGYSADGQARETISSGAKGFIGKPYQLKKLACLVSDLLSTDSQPPMS